MEVATGKAKETRRPRSAVRRPPSDLDFGPRVADDLVATLLRHGVDDDATVALLDDRAGDGDLLLREAHPAELDRQPFQLRRPTRGLPARARDLGHRVQPVQDVLRQPDLL